MAQLPDLPETLTDRLRNYVEQTLTAMETAAKIPWMDDDHRADLWQIALLARGIHTLSRADQEVVFHRLGEATDAAPARDRSSVELLYHTVEALNTAGDSIATPDTGNARDERLGNVPDHLLKDWRNALSTALVQHIREIREDAYPLAQNALLLFARDVSVGWGLSDTELQQSIDTAQAFYFEYPEDIQNLAAVTRTAVREVGFDWLGFRDLVIEDRCRARFAPTSGDRQQPPSDAEPAVPPDDDPAPSDHAENAHSPAHDGDAKGEAPDARAEEDQAIFHDEVLPDSEGILDLTDDDPHPLDPREEYHTRGTWPGDSGSFRQKKSSRDHDQQKAQTAVDPDPIHRPSFQEPTNPAGSHTGQKHFRQQAGDVANGSTVQVRSTFLSGVGEGVGGLLAGTGGLFAGVGSVLSRFAPRPEPSLLRWQERRADREQRREQKAREQPYRQAERFLDRFNQRLDLLRADGRVQETFRTIAEDRKQRADAVQDGANARIQQARHEAFTNAQWETALERHPDLRHSLTALEADAEQLPEKIVPAILALEEGDEMSRSQREGLLAKLDRAKAQSDDLPPSVPGQKSLADRMQGILAAIQNFLARIFGAPQPALTQNTNGEATSKPVQRQRQRP